MEDKTPLAGGVISYFPHGGQNLTCRGDRRSPARRQGARCNAQDQGKRTTRTNGTRATLIWPRAICTRTGRPPVAPTGQPRGNGRHRKNAGKDKAAQGFSTRDPIAPHGRQNPTCRGGRRSPARRHGQGSNAQNQRTRGNGTRATLICPRAICTRAGRPPVAPTGQPRGNDRHRKNAGRPYEAECNSSDSHCAGL